MKYRQLILDEPDGAPVTSQAIKVRRREDGAILTTLSTDANGFVDYAMDGHQTPFYFQAVGPAGGPRVWDPYDTFGAGTLFPLELPHGFRPFDGVNRRYANQLRASMVGDSLSVLSGMAFVRGIPVVRYSNGTPLLPLLRSALGTTIYRFVAWVDVEDGHAGFTLTGGTPGGGAPALAEGESDIWDLPLWRITVPTAGAITLTDEREFSLDRYLHRTKPISGTVRAQTASTEDTGGAILSGLSTALVLPDDVVYDIEASFSAKQEASDTLSVTAPTSGWTSISTVAFGSGLPNQIAIYDGELYVAAGNAIVVYDLETGDYVRHRTFTNPVGVAVDATGVYYVLSGLGGYIGKYNHALTVSSWQRDLALSGSTMGYAAIDDNYVFAASFGADVMFRIDKSGVSLATWGSSGSGAGQFDVPFGVARGGTSVWVTDYQIRRVQEFSTAGTYLGEWNEFGFQPAGIAYVTALDLFVVADPLNDRIHLVDDTGDIVLTYGSTGSGVGQLNAPVSADIVDGVLYVSENDNRRVSRMNVVDLTGYGQVAVSISGSGGGSMSSYLGIGDRAGRVSNVHTNQIQGPDTVNVRAYGKATTETLQLSSCILSARAVPRN